MDTNLKTKIEELQNQGVSFRKIAKILNISKTKAAYTLGKAAWIKRGVPLQRQKRQAFKLRLLALRSSCCELCGYSKCVSALEFHHKNPELKEFGICEKYNQSTSEKTFELCKKEIEKCLLLCSNCHHEVHEQSS